MKTKKTSFQIAKLSHLLLTITLILFWGCKKKDYAPPMAENNHLFITTSAGDFALAAIIYDTVSLIDLSRGIQNRTWTFDEGTVDVINSNNDLNSNEAVCKVAFKIPGVYEVPLHQEYSGDAYVGIEQIGSTSFDTIIRVVIFDSVTATFEMERLQPSDTALEPDYINDPLVIDATQQVKNPIWAGRYMRFFNTTAPNMGASSNWEISRVDVDFTYNEEGVDSVWDYKFTSLGVYNVEMTAFSEYDQDVAFYPGLVEVIASRDPIQLDAIHVVDESQEDGTDLLQMVFSRDMKETGDTLLDYLSLLVENGTDTIHTVAITKAERDVISNNIIWLTVSEELFNSDRVFISYNAAPGGTLRDNILFTTDGMAMPSFDDFRAQFEVVNIFEQLDTDADWNLEGLSEGDFWLWNGWQDQGSGVTFDAGLSRYERFSSPENEGEYSLYFEVPAGGTRCIFPSDVPIEEYDYQNKQGVTFRLPAGSYNFRTLIYVEDLGGGVYLNATEGTIPSDFRIYLSDLVTGNDELWYEDYVFDPDYPYVGQWTWIEPDNIHTAAATTDHYMTFRVLNRDNTGAIKLYIDRIEAIVTQMR